MHGSVCQRIYVCVCVCQNCVFVAPSLHQKLTGSRGSVAGVYVPDVPLCSFLDRVCAPAAEVLLSLLRHADDTANQGVCRAASLVFLKICVLYIYLLTYCRTPQIMTHAVTPSCISVVHGTPQEDV